METYRMVVKIEHAILLAVVLLGLAVRAIPLTKTSSLIGADGYFHLVMLKEIINTGFIRFWNPLSHGGKPLNYPPGFYALSSSLAQLSGLDPEILAMFFSLPFYLIILIYCYKKGGVVCAAAVAFSPVFVWKTLTNFLVDPLWVFLLAICFETNIAGIVSLFALSCTHSIAPIVILFLAAYRRKNFAAYIAALLLVGIWLWGGVREIPNQLQPFIFEGLDLMELIKRMGVPLIGIGLAPPVFIWALILGALVAAKFFELDRAIMAVLLLCHKYPSNIAVLILVLLQPLLAVYMMKFMGWAYPTNYLGPMKWIHENRESTVAGPYWLGYLIMGIAGRKNILDGNWESLGNQQRFNDLETILYGEKEDADPLLSKYNAHTIIGREKEGYERLFQSASTTVWG